MRTSRSKFLLLILAWSVSIARTLVADVAQNYGGTNNLAIIASPTSVLAWKTVAFSKGDGFPNDTDELWRKAGQPTIVATNTAAELSKVLLKESTYLDLRGSVKYSISQPCVVVNFSQGPKNLDVYFSFADNGLVVKSGLLFINSEIDPGRAELVRIIKKIFPNDSRVQALKESK